MKKFVLSIIVMASFGTYVIWQGGNNSSNNLALAPAISLNDTNTKKNSNSTLNNSNSPSTSNTIKTSKIPSVPSTSFLKRIFSEDDGGESEDGFSNNTVVSTPTINTPSSNTTTKTNVSSTTAIKNNGQYIDGSYVGDSVFAYNDSIQVKVIISGGKMTDIQFVQYPNRGRSGSISSFALPILKQEAITAQSANVDAVSGASYTSPAFMQSLASALTKAKA